MSTTSACRRSESALAPWAKGARALHGGAWLAALVLGWSGACGATPKGPVELRNSVEDVSGASVKALDLKLPTDGWLEVELLVHRGPGVTLHLISRAAGLSVLKAHDFRIYPELSATAATSARKAAWLPRGDYYLTLINPDAATASKVRIFARLRAGSPPSTATISASRE